MLYLQMNLKVYAYVQFHEVVKELEIMRRPLQLNELKHFVSFRDYTSVIQNFQLHLFGRDKKICFHETI